MTDRPRDAHILNAFWTCEFFRAILTRLQRVAFATLFEVSIIDMMTWVCHLRFCSCSYNADKLRFLPELWGVP